MSPYKCPKCRKVCFRDRYCKSCNQVHWRDNFGNWTSGDINIDELIRESQLDATSEREILEWIDYSNLENVKLVARGQFAKVYKATWKEGHTNGDFDLKKSKWNRRGKTEVAVKILLKATHSEFLDEVNKHI